MERGKLKAARYRAGLSQEALAERVGVRRSTVSEWERGLKRPYAFYVKRLCEVLNVKEPVELDLESTVKVQEDSTEESKRQTLRSLLASAGAITVLSTLDLFDMIAQNWLEQPTIESVDITAQDLTKFEKITANCWLLLKFDGLPTVDHLLPTYLLRVAIFALQTSQHQERSANIASQGCILAGLAAVLDSRLTESEKYCQHAVTYARIAKDRNLEAAALKHLATKHLDNNHPLEALHKYQEILPFIDELSPLLRSRTYLGLALAYARAQQKKEAFYHLDLAYATFPEYPETDPSFTYADCGTSSLNHYGGLIYTEFGLFDKAYNLFAEVPELSRKIIIPERTQLEILNCQAEVSLHLKDLKSSRDLIEASITWAHKLVSEKRQRDALSLYKRSRIIWPQERQIRDLADLFLR